jgi:PAS domain S-box-containing protein
MRHADGVGRWLPRACGLLAILLGALDLVGWQLDSLALKAVLPGLVAMQPVGASCLVLAGAALMLGTGSPPAMQAGAAAAACMVLLVSAEALAQYVTGADFGTDRLLFPQAVLRQPVPYAFPGRMAPAAAIEFSLLGAALLLVRARAIRARAAGVALATLGLLLAATALLGYLFDVGSLQRVGFYVAVALHLSLALFVLFAGVLVSASEVGWPRLLRGQGSGTASARLLLPAVLLGPVIPSWVAQQGVAAGLYDTEFRLALTTLGTSVLLTVVTLWSAARLNRSNAALREAEVRYRSIFDTAVDGVAVIDEQGIVQSFNRAAENLFGYAAAEVIGRNVALLMPELYRDEPHAYLERYRANSERRTIGREAEGRRQDGSTFPLELAIAEWQVNDRRFFTGNMRDLSERKAAEAALAASEAQLRTIVETVPVGLVMADLPSGRIIGGNACVETLVRPCHPSVLARLERADDRIGRLWLGRGGSG